MFLSSVVFFALFGSIFGACPDIVTRSEWGARDPNSITYLAEDPPPYIIAHHAESAACSSLSECSSMVRGFQDYHMDSNGWADIGYNFLIGEDGNIYEGRGWGITGAHAPNYNSISIGICFIGSFSSRTPNAAALAAWDKLIECGHDLYTIQDNYILHGHRQVTSTDCPGDALYNLVTGWTGWEPNL